MLTTAIWLCGDGGMSVKTNGLLANVVESDERRRRLSSLLSAA